MSFLRIISCKLPRLPYSKIKDGDLISIKQPNNVLRFSCLKSRSFKLNKLIVRNFTKLKKIYKIKKSVYFTKFSDCTIFNLKIWNLEKFNNNYITFIFGYSECFFLLILLWTTLIIAFH